MHTVPNKNRLYENSWAERGDSVIASLRSKCSLLNFWQLFDFIPLYSLFLPPSIFLYRTPFLFSSPLLSEVCSLLCNSNSTQDFLSFIIWSSFNAKDYLIVYIIFRFQIICNNCRWIFHYIYMTFHILLDVAFVFAFLL